MDNRNLSDGQQESQTLEFASSLSCQDLGVRLVAPGHLHLVAMLCQVLGMDPAGFLLFFSFTL